MAGYKQEIIIRDEPLIIVGGVSGTDFPLTFFFLGKEALAFFFFFQTAPLPFFFSNMPAPPTMINGSSLNIKNDAFVT